MTGFEPRNRPLPTELQPLPNFKGSSTSEMEMEDFCTFPGGIIILVQTMKDKNRTNPKNIPT